MKKERVEDKIDKLINDIEIISIKSDKHGIPSKKKSIDGNKIYNDIITILNIKEIEQTNKLPGKTLNKLVEMELINFKEIMELLIKNNLVETSTNKDFIKCVMESKLFVDNSEKIKWMISKHFITSDITSEILIILLKSNNKNLLATIDILRPLIKNVKLSKEFIIEVIMNGISSSSILEVIKSIDILKEIQAYNLQDDLFKWILLDKNQRNSSTELLVYLQKNGVLSEIQNAKVLEDLTTSLPIEDNIENLKLLVLNGNINKNNLTKELFKKLIDSPYRSEILFVVRSLVPSNNISFNDVLNEYIGNNVILKDVKDIIETNILTTKNINLEIFKKLITSENRANVVKYLIEKNIIPNIELTKSVICDEILDTGCNSAVIIILIDMDIIDKSLITNIASMCSKHNNMMRYDFEDVIVTLLNKRLVNTSNYRPLIHEAIETGAIFDYNINNIVKKLVNEKVIDESIDVETLFKLASNTDSLSNLFNILPYTQFQEVVILLFKGKAEYRYHLVDQSIKVLANMKDTDLQVLINGMNEKYAIDLVKYVVTRNNPPAQLVIEIYKIISSPIIFFEITNYLFGKSKDNKVVSNTFKPSIDKSAISSILNKIKIPPYLLLKINPLLIENVYKRLVRNLSNTLSKNTSTLN